MKLSAYKTGTRGTVKVIALSKKQQQRLLPLGIYKGAQILMEKQGSAHFPALLFVCGNLLMMRMVDISKIEMEE